MGMKQSQPIPNSIITPIVMLMITLLCGSINSYFVDKNKNNPNTESFRLI